MARDPDCFRHMEPIEMLIALIEDEAGDRRAMAAAAGARCETCMDSGMDRGRFCGCAAGARLGMQATRS